MSRIPVTFAPDCVTAWVEPDVTVADAARAAGIIIPSPCGGRGVCGSCGVKVVSGRLSDPDDAELTGLARAPKGIRLACRARIESPVELRPLVACSAVDKPESLPAGPMRELIAAVDLGTTSVAAVLIDAENGRELARVSVPNRQQVVGADVLTRIGAALAGDADLLRLHAEESVLDSLVLAARQAEVSVAWVTRLIIAGNSAMTGLIAGANVSTLAAYPFRAPVVSGTLASQTLPSVLASGAQIRLVPPIASFVGGDTLAAIVATRMATSPLTSLLVDLGTNAEIVVAYGGHLYVASAAAGPAFEGAGITCGGPAAKGAVTAVGMTDAGHVTFKVIGGGEPLWLSGSGVVSAVALLRRLGHIDASGLFLQEGPLEARFSRSAAGVAVFALGEGSGCLTLSQLDVRAVQLAKAAIQVGIDTVLRESGCGAGSLEVVHVAGAFGFSVNTDDLIALGILPTETVEIAERVGNAALDGAAMIALEADSAGALVELAAGVKNIELAQDAGFNDAFLAAMSLEPYSA